MSRDATAFKLPNSIDAAVGSFNYGVTSHVTLWEIKTLTDVSMWEKVEHIL